VREAAGEEAPDAGERAPDRKATGRAGAEEGLPPSKWPLTPRQPQLPDFERWGAVERIELRGVRRATAQRMALAWSQVPHVTHEDVADITELEQFRRSQSEEMASRGAKLTLTTLVVKAVVAALKEFPRFNASLDPEAGEIVLKRYYHVGVAVATDRGLLVPVIRDADRKTVIELATELKELAERARDGDLELEEMRGGTFSITNPGGIGGTRFTPIVNFPQVAILGCGRARLEPVAEGEIGSAQVSHRFRLPLCLGFDHRVNDGADAARFVNFIRELLGDPQSFPLAV
jgi:pyruvate dehydrogenase E2 component (dihydrolipoamide acetyltransferase)